MPRRQSDSSLVGDDDHVLRDVEKAEGKTEHGGPEKAQEQKDPNVIEWDGPDDPGNPMNWSMSKKYVVTMSLSMMTFVITFASSVFSTATQVTAKLYGVSPEVTTLGTSLFVLVGISPSPPGPTCLTATGLCFRSFGMGSF